MRLRVAVLELFLIFSVQKWLIDDGLWGIEGCKVVFNIGHAHCFAIQRFPLAAEILEFETEARNRGWQTRNWLLVFSCFDADYISIPFPPFDCSYGIHFQTLTRYIPIMF